MHEEAPGFRPGPHEGSEVLYNAMRAMSARPCLRKLVVELGREVHDEDGLAAAALEVQRELSALGVVNVEPRNVGHIDDE